eukprot:CAMPEP_0118692032 /NCGR_PEP_ID=MMETSP0800-20121206/11028_1 /TAXON_ID=210618 ORGANISM="Striatella unipunctata, Strain CCMP2910" /NCGR_SAMPLE_ID=MMETSP0800 /ASSEMBLY_ACC=CAM_ASM_000638 /LENGTH=59 /DNA_ID=CAMNT_0006589913 /DNA_START=155 /DNA_END=334 /DNA_ORIENTATION=-
MKKPMKVLGKIPNFHEELPKCKEMESKTRGTKPKTRGTTKAICFYKNWHSRKTLGPTNN